MSLREKYVGLLIIFVVAFAGVSSALAQPATKVYTEYPMGILQPLTGPGAYAGELSVNIMKLAAEEINAHGGIDGVPIKIYVEDHQVKPSVAVSGFRKLIDANHIQLCSIGYTAITLACAPVADAKEILLINMGGAGPTLLGAGKYLFHLITNMREELALSTYYVAKEKGVKRIGYIYVNDDMGVGGLDLLKNKIAPAFKLTLVASEAFDPAASDFRSLITKAKNWSVDAICIVAHSSMWQFFKQWGEMGLKKQFFASGSALGYPELVTKVGPQVSGTIFGTQQMETTKFPIAARAKASFAAKYGAAEAEKLTATRYNCYDTVYLYKTLIERSKAKGGDYFSGKRLRDELLKLETFETGTGPTSFDLKTGACIKDMMVCTIGEVSPGKYKAGIPIKEYGQKEVANIVEMFSK